MRRWYENLGVGVSFECSTVWLVVETSDCGGNLWSRLDAEDAGFFTSSFLGQASSLGRKSQSKKTLQRRQSSLFPAFSPKQQQRDHCSPNASQRKGGTALAAAKRRPKQNSNKTGENLAASLGLTKAERENGVLDMLDIGRLNGNWLSKVTIPHYPQHRI